MDPKVERTLVTEDGPAIVLESGNTILAQAEGTRRREDDRNLGEEYLQTVG